MNVHIDDRVLTPDELEAELRAIGAERYHHLHPFHVRMNNGELSREELQRWVANRYMYQVIIPIKDAAILSNCPDRAVRRSWVQRILDHDGYGDDPGGIDSWLRLAEAVGLARERCESLVDVLPGVRFAVDAYVNFARRAQAAARMENGVGLDLMAEIRRGIDQEPSFAIAAHRQRCLGPGQRPGVASTRAPARFSVRIPLRESTAGRSPEDDGLHGAIGRLGGRGDQRSAQA